MKFKNLDQEIKTINGMKIMVTEKEPLTIRKAIVAVCELYQGGQGTGETLKAYNIGIKIMNAKDEVELAKEEVDLLSKIITNSQQFVAVVVGRLLEFINKTN